MTTRSPVTIDGSWFSANVDHIDVTLGGGGWIHDNVFDGSRDDAVDLDHLTRSITVERDLITSSTDDGIEMRLHDDTIATTVVATFRANTITGGRDGIQLIDYYTDTDRRIVIERNLIHHVSRAAISLLDNEVTNEDYRAASIREPVDVVHNTFVANNHGISGGDSLVAVNNVIAGHVVGIKNVDASSIASRNLFWNNATHTIESNVEGSVIADPLLDASYVPTSASPTIDAGWTTFAWAGRTVLDAPSGSYSGTAPDLGWKEFAGAPPTNEAPVVDAGPDTSVTRPDAASLPGSASDDGLPVPPGSLEIAWSQVSGPGSASFGDAAAAATTATFDVAGTYVLRLQAFDGSLNTADEVTVTVLDPDPGDDPPQVHSVSITPAIPRTNDLVTAVVDASDPDGDPITLDYSWSRNGAQIVGAAASTLDLSVAGAGDRGDAIAVTVTASGVASSSPTASAPVTVADSPPVFAQDLGALTNSEGDAISLSAAAYDADGDAITYVATGLPTGLMIGASTGLISGRIAADAAAQSPYPVSVATSQGGTAGPTDTFTWTVTAPPPPTAIAFRATSTGTIKAKNVLRVPRPAGLVAGDVELATILSIGSATIAPPAGWSAVRSDTAGTTSRQSVFVHVAGAAEPDFHRWTFSASVNAAGVVVAYTGVDVASPIAASSGQGVASATSIVAPSVSAVAGARLVGCFGVTPSRTATITTPVAMTARAQAASGGTPRSVLACADEVRTTTGDTGPRTATSTRAGPALGQLVVCDPPPDAQARGTPRT